MAMSRLGSGGEFDLIRTFLAGQPQRPHPLIEVGPGDDCAVIGGLAISTDLSIENIHFRRSWLTPREIGYRAVVAAFSDLAAVAAQPVAALVSFAIPAADTKEWAGAVMLGVAEALGQYDAILAGGDVSRSSADAAIDVVAIGSVEKPVLRSTANAGDEVWVTGALGGAAAAVAAWLSGRQPAPAARERYARPAARITEAALLSALADLTALIDLSDGIAGDARHIAAASGCRLVIDAALLPVQPGASLENALGGGEDYELCICAPSGSIAAIREAFTTQTGTALTRIGDVIAGEGVEIRNGPAGGGFDHFAAGRP